jgi:putative addiction module killer protein
VYEVRHYLTEGGKDIFQDWRNRLRDYKVTAAIDRRIFRLELGNFGDHKFLQDGVSELRIEVGPGYRLYYATEGTQVVLLLCGGDKGTQRADIKRACSYWRDWRARDMEEQK